MGRWANIDTSFTCVFVHMYANVVARTIWLCPLQTQATCPNLDVGTRGSNQMGSSNDVLRVYIKYKHMACMYCEYTYL